MTDDATDDPTASRADDPAIDDQSRPRAVDDLEISEVDDGLAVLGGERVHHLNHIAGLVLTLADGSMTAATIADEIGRLFRLEAPPHDEVRGCLQELAREGLVAF